MKDQSEKELQVIFDHLDRSAIIVMGERTATIPFPVHSQREANIMGKEVARNLGWFDKLEKTISVPDADLT